MAHPWMTFWLVLLLGVVGCLMLGGLGDNVQAMVEAWARRPRKSKEESRG